jgi:hypothetical protein
MREIFPTDSASKLQRYLAALQDSNERLPRVGRIPNKTRIAELCGFSRYVFSSNVEAKTFLNDYDKEERLRFGIAPPAQSLCNLMVSRNLAEWSQANQFKTSGNNIEQ